MSDFVGTFDLTLRKAAQNLKALLILVIQFDEMKYFAKNSLK